MEEVLLTALGVGGATIIGALIGYCVVVCGRGNACGGDCWVDFTVVGIWR